MKIGLVLDDSLDRPDGVQQYILTLGRWYAACGHEVHFLVGETHRTDIPNVHSLSRNLRVRFNKNRMSIPFPANKSRLQKLLNSELFDVLHVQMPYSPMLAARVVKLAPKSTAIVGTFHIVGISKLEKSGARLLGLYLWKNLRRFDAFVAASRPAAAFAKSSFRARCTVVPNTVDVSAFRSGRPLKKYQDGKLNILFLGRLVPRKGCQQLLEALQLLHEKHSLNNIRVIICGKGPLEGELKRYTARYHLQHVIHFVGFINEADKPDYLATAEIAVFPSLGGECFGIVLIEAMAAGSRAIVAGDNIGYRSVMSQRPDQLVDANDVKALAAKLRHFIVSGRARQAASHWQKKTVEQYDVRVVGGQLLEIYKSAIAKQGMTSDNEA